MKVLFIGGTGNISTSVSKLCVQRGIDLYLLNRGNRKVDIPGAKIIHGDISKPDELKSILQNHNWDSVVNWIAFNVGDVERDYKLFEGKTKQYIFISSASVYEKPLSFPIVTESSPIKNPFWDYSQNKIECEEKLNMLYRDKNFPMVIVRPSLTYDTVIPLIMGGWTEYTIIDRMKKGKKVIVHGDGTSLWTITHAEDFAKGFVGLIGHQQSVGQAFHITSDEVLTWNQIYEAVAHAAGVEPNIVHIASDFIAKYDKNYLGSLLGDKSYSAVFDNTKIKRFVPDYVAVIPFKEGIKRTLAWFEAEPERMVIKKESNDLIDKLIEKYESLY